MARLVRTEETTGCIIERRSELVDLLIAHGDARLGLDGGLLVVEDAGVLAYRSTGSEYADHADA